ncbi:beta-lactamase hydrolase domain-containing protein, partial [Klebsiella pneumoniae]|uniref:beta-lactamase hydrolase domain-containing protein n=1 Tax=Klebsiella pneumoniae TaxID=573 RepID=UPI003F51F2D8
QASEAGAELEAEAAAAQAAGITYVHLPFNTASPDPAVVDQFLKAVSAPANQPAFVHCASANRASALWMIKRMLVDGWDAD